MEKILSQETILNPVSFTKSLTHCENDLSGKSFIRNYPWGGFCLAFSCRPRQATAGSGPETLVRKDLGCDFIPDDPWSSVKGMMKPCRERKRDIRFDSP